MRVRRLGALFVALAALVVFAEASCRTAPVRRGPRIALEGARVARWVAPPSVRVGVLVEVPRSSIAADSGVVVVDAAHESSGTLGSVVQRATFVCVGSTSAGPDTWRVQIGSLADAKTANEVARRAERALGLRAVVRWNSSTETHQVRVGEWRTRDEARGTVARIAERGFPSGWAVDDESSGGRVRVVETGEELATALVFPVRAGEDLSVDGAPYRGVIEARADGGAGVTVVNVVNVEDYLRGVVPNEMSPRAYPQVEALKAQAVAARTYVLKNRGQFSAKGFDICSTSACQVYRGKSSEQDLSDEAVRATRGIVATYRGELINAFYTSTCGGHTEDGENVFEGRPVPYLRGVACAAEGASWKTIRTQAPVPLAAIGDAAPHDVALLSALGVIEAQDAASLGLPGEGDVERWTGRLLGALSRSGCAPAVDGPLTKRGRFFAYVVGHVCWEERARRLLQANDLAYLLQLEDRADLSSERERLASALLIHEQILAPFSDNTLRPGEPITRAQAFALFARLVARAAGPRLVSGEFVDASGGGLTLRVDGEARTYELDPGVRLFRSMDGPVSAASELLVVPGDTIRLVERDHRVVFLEAVQNAMGTAADRGSRYYHWEVRLTPTDIARGVAKQGSVGVVRDVVPRRLGVSGRVVELAVVGSDGELVLKGLAIRWALGLRENLFVIDREVDANGVVQRFVFSGKGWGHGVGLCQVGAAGLAQTGESYDTILKHYYTGIDISRQE